jgi:thioredoxin reductase
MRHPITDLAIIGGGPVGLFATYYAGLRNISCSVIESLPALGGRLVSVFPEKFIYDVPGFPKVRARDLANNLILQAKESNPKIFLSETVENIKPNGDFYCLTTNLAEHHARAILIVSGIGVSTPQKHTALGAQKFEGAGIEYIVTNPENYRGKNVVIAGGGDSAIDWARELLPIASSVAIVHRTARFRAHERNVNELRESGARIITDTEITAFEGKSHLHRVHLKHRNAAQEETVLPADAALIMFGFRTDLSFMTDWGLNLTDDESQILVSPTMQTCLPGVFAAGDIASHNAKITLLATGFGEAAIAINYIKNYLDPTEDTQPMYSTSVMENKA